MPNSIREILNIHCEGFFVDKFDVDAVLEDIVIWIKGHKKEINLTHTNRQQARVRIWNRCIDELLKELPHAK